MRNAEYYLNKLWEIFKQNYAGSSAVPMEVIDTATAPANTAVTIGYAAEVGIRHALSGVVISYSAAPTGGRLTVAEGAVTLFDVDIIAGGVTSVSFGRGKAGGEGVAMTITLAAGGGAIVGKLNVMNHWTE